MKYLKKYNKNLSRDIQSITELDYINFTNERVRDVFTQREINQISDLRVCLSYMRMGQKWIVWIWII